MCTDDPSGWQDEPAPTTGLPAASSSRRRLLRTGAVLGAAGLLTGTASRIAAASARAATASGAAGATADDGDDAPASASPADPVPSGPPPALRPRVDAVTVAPGLDIQPRDAWGADLPPKGPITGEEVRFLLVHHTASPNSYSPDGARAAIRSVYGFQTGPAKGWVDTCYEFFVDRYGVVWEGRAGALDAPVRADATGGSQGWAQLVCLIGDFTSVQPTPAALDALIRVLAWLADRSQLDTSPGATATFVSRGSQRWPAGAVVTTSTIAPHKAMSYTECPGNAFAPFVERDLQARVHAARRGRPAPVPGDDGLFPGVRGVPRLVNP